MSAAGRSRKGRESGVRTRVATTLDDYRSYFAAYEDSLRRWGEGVTLRYPWDLFEVCHDLARRYPAHVKLWLAERDGETLGGALNFYWNQHAVGWHSAAYTRALDSYAFAVLVADAVDEACDRGFAWFDLNPSGGLEGVAAFKSRFGGERRAIARLRYQTWLLRSVARARSRPATCEGTMSAPATFYTVTDAEFFPGTVALLNSLRLVGHREPLVVLDNGLTPEQRKRLDRVATVVDVPEGSGSMPPPTLKPFPHLLDATGTVAIIDSDMIVCASLAPALSLATRRQDLPLRRAGLAERSRSMVPGVARALCAPCPAPPAAVSQQRLRRLLDRSVAAPAGGLVGGVLAHTSAGSVFTSRDHALRLGDSDALNAILMSEVDAESVVLPADGLQAAPGDEVVVADEDRLVCLREGVQVSLLHHWARPKVWSRQGPRSPRHA